MESNTFDEILGLEETFYNDGHKQGFEDGVKAGQIEGRTFGLEKGFEKYVESGRLHGKSLVWANRLPQSHNFGEETTQQQRLQIPQISPNLRLSKHVKVFYALAESDSLSTENTEEAVSDFDDRLKRAQAKAKIIERMAGEATVVGSSSKDGSIEDISVLNNRH